MALYMLYHTRAKSGSHETLTEIRDQFKEIYDEHKIEIVGFWENKEDPTETYYITRYEDESDYQEKVSRLQADERYSSLTKKLDESRVTTKATRLNPMGVPE